MQRAMQSLAQARSDFLLAAREGLILGNDNHVGDIGEYWARMHFEETGLFDTYHSDKNGSYDIRLQDGRCVSVKTVTAWSEHGKGAQVKPLCGTNWTVLAAVKLDRDLFPDQIAVVPLADILLQDPFRKNELRRFNGSKTFPVFQWWGWLDKYVTYRRVTNR
jgi:hypothetical protein